MSRDNLIVAQCCFKGAIDLAIANRISTEEINKLTKVWTDFIIAEYGGGTTAVVPAKPVFQPKENYKGNSDKKPKIANPNDDASEAQLKYINSLIKSGQVTKGVAHGLIEQLKGKIDDNEPVARTPKSSAEAQF
jgi:hypothetical protein